MPRSLPSVAPFGVPIAIEASEDIGAATTSGKGCNTTFFFLLRPATSRKMTHCLDRDWRIWLIDLEPIDGDADLIGIDDIGKPNTVLISAQSSQTKQAPTTLLPI